jgi:hypothetical protein
MSIGAAGGASCADVEVAGTTAPMDADQMAATARTHARRDVTMQFFGHPNVHLETKLTNRPPPDLHTDVRALARPW